MPAAFAVWLIVAILIIIRQLWVLLERQTAFHKEHTKTMSTIQDTIDGIKTTTTNIAPDLDLFIANHSGGEVVTDQERTDLLALSDALKNIDSKLTTPPPTNPA